MCYDDNRLACSDDDRLAMERLDTQYQMYIDACYAMLDEYQAYLAVWREVVGGLPEPPELLEPLIY